MHHHLVLRVVSKFLIPPILIFALYVQFHGDFGPGGGFQAGVIFAVGFVLYALVYGVTPLLRAFSPAVFRTLMAMGVLLFAGTGLYSILVDARYLDYDALAHEPEHGQHLGILLVEFGVGMTVAGVIVAIFVAFASRPPTLKDEDW